MSIGTTIKRLRRERNITQEQLAERMGISTGAVSQWECDRTAPDITQLPVLADIFEVSADILLEIDLVKSKRAREITVFKLKCDELYSKGENEERLTLCREMSKKYPNDETVMCQLLKALKITKEKECYNEIVEIGERLLLSKDLENRHTAIRCLCFAHEVNGNHESALKLASMIPTNEDLFIHILKDKELLEHCHQYFANICNRMFMYVNSLMYLQSEHYSAEERHSVCQKLYDIYHIVHEQRDFCYMDYDRLGRLCFRMAQDSSMCGNTEQAIDELEKMVYYFDKMTAFDYVKHTSLLINTVSSDADQVRKRGAENIYSTFLHYMNKRMSCFDNISEEPRFIAVRKLLEERSNVLPV